MVGMPYLLLGSVGFLIYRGMRQKAAAEQQAGPPLSDEGDNSCSTRLTADDS